MKRLRLVQLPVPQPAALAATGNVPLAAGCLGVAARVHGLAERGLSIEVVPPAITDSGLLADLAEQVARDGEGAKKLVTINVTGAANAKSARRIALAIANSPLVKTAIAGEDANWGRIVMAVGKSGEKADRDKLVVSIGGQPVTKNGMVRPDYDEAKATQHLRGQEVSIAVDVGVGKGSAKVWTCDLTHGYIDINADYRS